MENKIRIRIKIGIGSIIRKHRLRKGHSLQKVAEKIGISRSFLCSIEAGDKNFTFDIFLSICDYCEVGPHILLFKQYIESENEMLNSKWDDTFPLIEKKIQELKENYLT